MKKIKRKMWKKIVQDMIDGKSDDPTDGETHFYSGNNTPYWAKNLASCKEIVSHKFFKGIASFK